MSNPHTTLPSAALENLQFLVAEVAAQCVTLRKALTRGEPKQVQRVVDRAGYAANLKERIQANCIEAIADNGIDERYRLQTAGLSEVAHQLERITDKFRDLSRELLEVSNLDRLGTSRFRTPLTRLRDALDLLAETHLPPTSSDCALTLSKQARGIERQAQKLHDSYVEQLKTERRATADLSQGILMAHGLRQIGDALMGVSESLLTIQLGQPMKFDRFHSLRTLMEDHPELAGSRVKTIAETRSGSAIAGLVMEEGEKPAAIFKDGLRRKLKEERKGVESWHEFFPGLAPRILAYNKRGESAALLIEHLPGMTFEQILVSGSDELLQAGFSALRGTLKEVWNATRSDERVSAKFMAQLEARLPEIRSSHGSLIDDGMRIGTWKQIPFERLIARVAKLERALPPPFSVYIHGDFNVDNIIYDPEHDRIHFIDLHRSRYMDYLQDVSVFMVSCFRLPARDEAFNERVRSVILEMDRTARRFARRNSDEYYDFRLALGLARSLATSTRFIADRAVVARMLARSRYLMERILDIDPARATNFTLPIKEIFIDTHAQ